MTVIAATSTTEIKQTSDVSTVLFLWSCCLPLRSSSSQITLRVKRTD